ncbi:MAG: hypothetical protein OXD40_14505 [bacterium]|nr:hypothetical protein [bacterium]
MVEIKTDTNGSLYVQWKQGTNKQGHDCEKRAWVQHKEGENDWAGTKRYLNVVRCNSNGLSDLQHATFRQTDFARIRSLSKCNHRVYKWTGVKEVVKTS